MTDELVQKMGALGAMTSVSSALASAGRDSVDLAAMVDDAARAGQGVSPSARQPARGGGGGGGGVLTSLQGPGTTAKPAPPPPPPEVKSSVTVSAPGVQGGSVANAASVVAGMVPGFRRCYRAALGDDPKLTGTVGVDASLGPQGEVVSAKAKGSAGLPAKLIACLQQRVAFAQFAVPEGGKVTISIQVKLAVEGAGGK